MLGAYEPVPEAYYEDFKDCLPEKVSTYLNEQRVSEVSKAAVLVDEYVLTHKPVFVDRPFSIKPIESINGAGKGILVVLL